MSLCGRKKLPEEQKGVRKEYYLPRPLIPIVTEFVKELKSKFYSDRRVNAASTDKILHRERE